VTERKNLLSPGYFDAAGRHKIEDVFKSPDGQYPGKV
jgi:hypothetical protein